MSDDFEQIHLDCKNVQYLICLNYIKTNLETSLKYIFDQIGLYFETMEDSVEIRNFNDLITGINNVIVKIICKELEDLADCFEEILFPLIRSKIESKYPDINVDYSSKIYEYKTYGSFRTDLKHAYETYIMPICNISDILLDAIAKDNDDVIKEQYIELDIVIYYFQLYIGEMKLKYLS